MIDLDELERLEREATPGPWGYRVNPHGGARVQTGSVGIADVLSRGGVPHPVQEHCGANARLIATARNALPDLLAELHTLRARVAEMEEENERLRVENERLRAKLEDIDRIGRDALRKGGHPAPDDGGAAYAIGWLEARNDREFRATQAQREAAIYVAVFANAYPHVSARVAMSHAEDAVEAWRAALNGGSDDSA